MKKFKLHLGRSATLVNAEATQASELDYAQERYNHIAWSKIDTDGDIMEIGMQPCGGKFLIETLKDDPLFELEAHIEVWKYHEEKLYEFDGTLFDALLVIANEGAKYDV
ncbi:MAG: hypothetical protein DRI37_02920 [Chloroflexi bacterium]|nr:MAG: hypothetical protein DRI37_02920 [Chloroflexota bacterium]